MLVRKAKTVDAYIQAAPKETQAKLRQLRGIIRATAPHAHEKISYGMPYYSYKGRLVYFALAKHHIGFYIMPPIVETFKAKLKNYSTSKGTVQFPLDQKLPVALIRTLMKARVKWNDAKAK